MRVLIIGGCGAFGTFYARLLQQDGFTVLISGRDADATQRHCAIHGFIPFDGNFTGIDMVILSVPNTEAPALVKKIAPKLKAGTLLCDFCSVKSAIVPALQRVKKKNIELASLHPMHGPRIATIVGQLLVTIPLRTGEKYDALIEFFDRQQVHRIESTAKEHDKVLSVVQGLTHYAQFVSASTIRALGLELRRAKEFSSPNFELFISLMSRIVLQNPTLYAEIQVSNKFNKKMRQVFTKKAAYLEKIAKKGDAEEFAKVVIASAKIFNSSEDILYESDRVVAALKFVETTLKEHIGKKRVIENVSTKRQHYGIIRSVSHKEVVIEEGKQATHLALGKVKLLTVQEMKEWKKAHLHEKHFDYSFLAEKEATRDILEKAFLWIDDARISVIDEFESPKFPEGKKSVTIKALFFDEEDKERIAADITKTITGLGFTRR